MQQVQVSMKRMNASPEAIGSALRPGAKILMFDMTLSLLEPVKRFVQVRLGELSERQRLEFRDRNVSNPEYLQLRSDMEAASAYVEELRHLYARRFDEYPTFVAKLIEDAPLISPEERQNAMDNLGKFEADFERLKAGQRMENHGAWFAEVVKRRTA